MKNQMNIIYNFFLALLKAKTQSTNKKRSFPAHVRIMSGTRISADSIIEDYTYIGYYSVVTRAIIGRYCSIADYVSIGSGEHILTSISTSTLFCERPYELLTSKDCQIGNDVWIGVDSVIRRGIKIGNGAVVGANSFVNIDVPDFAIVAGNPARIIRYRFSDETITKIKESHWWEYELEEAKDIIAQISSMQEHI